MLARNGEAVIYNYAAGISGAPFLHNVYKSFGLSSDSHYFLYLKANGKFPTFALYCYDLAAGTERQLTDAAVHYASWSPVTPVFAYIWVDSVNQFHISQYDLTSEKDTEIATGQMRSDFLEWSPDAQELLYLTLEELTDRAAEDGQYTQRLHRYSLRRHAETTIAAVDWAQFSGGQLVVLSQSASLPYRGIPNPKGEAIHKFAIAGGRTYAGFVENGRPVVKRWNEQTRIFEHVGPGQIFLSTARGIVTRQFTASGIDYDYISNGGIQPLGGNPSGITWKIPFQGLASMIQGGQSYSDGSCDGAACFVNSHTATLGYALDWQQIPENQEGTAHVLATADGTVAIAAHNVTCNTATPGCVVGWDDYNPNCPVTNFGAGNYIAIAHLDGTYSFYGHLKSGSFQVTAGENVLQGAYIADQGHSGVAGSYNKYLSCGDHLHFSRQIGPGVWEQSVPTDFAETPCLMGCRVEYASANVEVAPAPVADAIAPSSWIPGSSVQVILTGRGFLYGSTVNINGSGIAVSGVSVLSAARIAATFTIAAATAPGPYSVTVTSANGTSAPVLFQVVAPASGGTLAGAVATPSGTQQLTAQGTADWAHWGLTTVQSFNHKAAVVQQIANASVIGAGAPSQNASAPAAFTWTDGTPAASASNTLTGISVSGQNTGFGITAPADTALRTLTVYVAVTATQGQMVAQLSDGSAPDYIDTSLSNGGGSTAGAYTFTYRAASAGQTLAVSFTSTSASGNVTLQAATLAGPSAVPDFALSATPAIQSAAPGASASYTLNIAALSGFTGNVDLSVNGLPAGVTAAFNPTPIAGSGTSTLTLTASSGTALGNYPLTIAGSSGTISHTAPITLAVVNADFGLSAAPATRAVALGASAAQTITIMSLPGFSGSVGLSVSGLPSGVTANFSPPSLTGSGISILTMSAAAGTAPGNYPLTVTASSVNITHTANFTLAVVSAPPDGSLAGSTAIPSGTVALTSEGTLDWAHWGLNAAADFNHKAGVAQQISYTRLGGSASTRFTGNPTGFTWSDGTPTASASTNAGIFMPGQDRGFRITVPADTTVRTLRVYVTVFASQGRLLAQLSDGSAPDYLDTSLNNSSDTTVGMYTLAYKAASAGQTLTVTYTQNNDTIGNVTLEAATLAGPPDFSVSAAPATQSVVAGGSVDYTVTVSALAGFSGAVSFSVSGLPAGATTGFNPTTVTGGGSSILTVTPSGGTAPGDYPLTITATCSALSHTANVTLTVTAPGVGGVLAGSLATPPINIQLTTEGTLDWAHWGLNTATDFNHKAGVAQQISNFTSIAGGTAGRYTNNGTAYSWSDGSPTASVSNSTTGVYLIGQNQGFRITVPAETAVRTLRVYVGAWRATSRIVAHLSDGSAVDYIDTSINNTMGATTVGVYTFTYSAASASQTLTVTFTATGISNASGNVTLQAATLSGGTVTPDFLFSATPSTQTTTAGGNGAYTVTVTALNGFTGNVGFNVSGLPAGATASFNPTTVAGGGSSTVTVTTASGTAPGSYALAINAISGTLSHTTNVTLSITDFTVAVAPATQSTVAGSGTTYTASVSALNGFTGAVSFSVSGLPAGATATFTPATVSGSGSSTLTVTTTSGSPPANYPLTITAAAGPVSHTASATLTVTAAAAGGALTGAVATPAASIQLTTEGSSDWAHWGLNTSTDFDHKSGVTQQISNFAVIGGTAANRYANNPISYTWTDGTPNASASNSTTGVYIPGQGNGFRITAPADTTTRTLRVYVGVWRAQGSLLAHLSDNSAPDYLDSSVNVSVGTASGVYTLTYSAASAGQTLAVTFTQANATIGNVTLQAATRAGGLATPDFSLTATPPAQSAAAGANAQYTVTAAALNGFTGNINLSVSGLPPGASASFSPAGITNSGSSTLTVSTAAGTAPGAYPLVVTATSGTLSHNSNLALNVTDFSVSAGPATQSALAGGSATYTVSVSAVNGFSGAVGFTNSGLPAGATAGFNPATVTGSGSSTLTITTAAGTAAASYPMVITATGGGVSRTANITLDVTDFSVGAAPGAQSATAGTGAVYTVSVSALNGFAGSVGFSVSGLTTGATAGFNPATLTGSGSSTLTVTTAAGTTAASYPLLITATSGGVSHTANITLTVTSAPDFSISAAPPTQPVMSGDSGAYTITIGALNGFTGNIGLSVTGLPAGATAGFAPGAITDSGSSTLTISTAAGTVAGAYPLVVTATSGTLSHTANITLNVTDFSVGAAPSTQSAVSGGSGGYTVTVSALNGFTGSIGLAVAGLPAGATAGFSPANINNSGSSTLTITTTAGTPTGAYALVLTATSGTLSHTANLTLNVTDFSVTTVPATQSAVSGGSAAYTVTVSALNGFTGSVGLAVAGLPAGATAGFSPANINNSGSSTLTITTTAGTPTGAYALVLTATSGTLSHTANLTLNVTDFSVTTVPATQSAVSGGSAAYTVTVSALNGFTGSVALSVTGLPTGATAGLSPASITDSGSSTLTITTAVGTAAANYPLTVTAANGAVTRTANLTLNVTDFSISAAPSTQSTVAGGSAAYSVTVSALNGFGGSVSFTVNGLPAGATADFSPASIAGSGASTMTITTAAGTPPANYPLIVVSSGGPASHTANVTLTVTGPPDFTLGVAPGTQSAAPGGSANYTLSVSSLNGFSGVVGFAVSGLPAGATVAFNPISITGAGSSTMTVTTAAGTAATNYPLTVTATAGSLTHTANANLTVTVAGTGVLAGSIQTPAAAVSLTSEGTTDWAHWGLNTAADFNHKAGVVPQISNFTSVSGGTAGRYTDNGTGYSWTDGSPAASASNSTTGLYLIGQNQGFRITVPAETAVRTLRVYVGAWRANGRIVAHLSDGSAVDYTDTSIINTSGPTTLGVYTFTYSAASAGQTLTVTFTALSVSGASGNVTLQAATLSGGTVTPDFSISATPSTQSVIAGNNAVYTLTVAALSGFSDTVALSISGLPAGTIAGFNPVSFSAGGSSTLTVNTNGAPVGSYPLTVTATAGALSHTVNLTLSVTAAGALSGSLATPVASIQLTTEGTADWAHWGLNAATDYNHKNGVTPQIGNFVSVAGGTAGRYANNGTGYTWTDGTPTISASNTTTGLYLAGQNQGFRLTLPADTTLRTVRVYVGAWRAQGKMVAHLSDGSAADYIDTTIVNTAGPTTLGVYTFTYKAGANGQTLTLTFTQTNATTGNVTLQAATLQ